MKYLTFFLLIILFLGCGNEPTKSDDNIIPEDTIPTLAITPENLSIGVGAEGDLTFQIKDFDDSIFGISMRIAYDSTVASFSEETGFTIGDFFGQNIVTFVQGDSNLIYLTITLTQGQEPVSDTGDLGILTFIGKSPGSSSVSIMLSELHFYNSVGSEIIVADLVIESATITVQ